MGKISKAIKEVTQGARQLEKVTSEVTAATKKAEQALQRTAKSRSSASKNAEAASAKGKQPSAVGKSGKVGKYRSTYARPSGYRSGVRDKVWNNAVSAANDGKVRDPLTSEVMSKDKPWDMGHKPRYEFKKHRASAAGRGIDRKQFLDEHNDPRHYWPELPSSNQGHQGEDHTDDYFGP